MLMRRMSRLFILVLTGLGTVTARAQTCLSWSTEFAGNDLDERARASAYFDDGTGSALYVGGSFLNAGGQPANHIARWNGSTWSAVGSGVSPTGSATSVDTLQVFDDGSGPALYAGGTFNKMGGITSNGIARWRAGSWQAVAGGLVGNVKSLVIYDDGSGPALFAGGEFLIPSNPSASVFVARWTGSAWIDTGLQWGTNGIEALVVFGGELYAGSSQLITANGASKGLAKYDGSQWWPVAGIPQYSGHSVYALAVFDIAGTGPVLGVGGDFTVAGGQTVNGIAAWNGASWSPLGTGVGDVRALQVYDDGLGPALYAGGNLTLPNGSKNIAKWDGFAWTSLETGVNATVYHLNTRTTAQGSNLLAFGDMTSAGGKSVGHMAEWNGGTWISHGNGFSESGSPSVWTLAEYDDGTGPAMYAGGPFNKAGPISSVAIARWGYGAWSAMPTLNSSVVNAMVGYDDGTGKKLYAATEYDIQRWDGSAWSAPGLVNGRIEDLTEFNDGTGNALYAVGSFLSVNGTVASGCASFDGSSWQGFPGINSNQVTCAAVFDSGTGPSLYAAGSFTVAGGNSCSRIARWDGSAWQPVGLGLNNQVNSLVVHNDGSGAALYACGTFTQAGGATANQIARWNGAMWSPVGTGLTGGGPASFANPATLASLDLGGGPKLYVGGQFGFAAGGTRIAMAWDGSAWSAVGDYAYQTAYALAVFDDGTGPKLFAAGDIRQASAMSNVGNIIRLDGATWTQPAGGFNSPVRALAVYDDGNGPRLYAGGNFYYAFGVGPMYHVAKWNGSSWTAVGNQLNINGTGLEAGEVDDLKVCDLGAGPVLMACGKFQRSGSRSLAHVAVWDGHSWEPPNHSGMIETSVVKSMAVLATGTGSKVFFAGNYWIAGADICLGVARWKGSAWEPVGAAGDGFDGYALASAVFDDGTGAALYVGGTFQNVDGTAASRIARWDGAAWTGVGSGMNGGVGSLKVHDDGTGSALYAAGGFTTAGAVGATGIARWNGASWSPIGGGVTGGVGISALSVYDDGSGASLYAAGSFSSMGGNAVSNIAKWDGSAWSGLGLGISAGSVSTLAVGGPPGAKRLFAGGTFTLAGGVQSLRIASWGPCPPRASEVFCPSDFNQDRFVSGEDFDAFVDAFYIGAASADVNRDAFVNGDDFDYFVEHFEAGC